MRTCPRCKTPKPIEEFCFRRRVIKSGVRFYPYYCRPCDNAYQRECHAKKLKPPKITPICKHCGALELELGRRLCPGCRKKQRRIPEHLKRPKKTKEETRKRIRAWCRETYPRRKATCLHYNRIRKARQKGATGHCSMHKWRERLAFFGWQCLYCKRPLTIETATRDHKIPVSAPKSYNWPSNLVPACKSCNARRQNKPFLVFLRQMAEYPLGSDASER